MSVFGVKKSMRRIHEHAPVISLLPGILPHFAGLHGIIGHFALLSPPRMAPWRPMGGPFSLAAMDPGLGSEQRKAASYSSKRRKTL